MLAHLADVSIRSVLLALVAAIALWALRNRRTAAWEHAVWAAVVCGMLALFALGQILPRLPLRVLDSPASSVDRAMPSGVAAPAIFDAVPEAAQLPARVPLKTWRPIDWRVVALFVYAAIAFGFLARFVMGMFLVRRLLGRSCCVGKFSESEVISVPSTVGWLHPRILLPLDWRTWEQEKLDAVLTHEGAHVRRRDGLVSALAHVNRCVFWFHPLAWMLERKVSILAEQACDESTVAVLGNREKYARLLLEMASVVDGSQGRLRGHVLTMAAGSHIRQRIDSLLQEGRTFSRGLSWVAWAALALCGIPVVLCAGAVELDHQPPLLQLEVSVLKIPAPPLPVEKRTELKRQLLAQARTVPAQPAAPQSVPAAAPKFEVASIKQCEPGGAVGGRGGRGGGGMGVTPGRLNVTCMPVMFLIQIAYVSLANAVFKPVDSVPISGGPAWLNSDRYSIEAKAEGNPDRQMMEGPMLRALLEDRFRLKIHHQTREIPVYELTVAKSGFKLKPMKEGDCTPFDPLKPPDPASPPVHLCGIFQYGKAQGNKPASVEYDGMSLDEISTDLFQVLDRPTINKTGIAGMFNFHLDFAPDGTIPRFAPAVPDDPTGGSSIFTAFQEQLGLKLVATKGPGESLVIDHVERPSEN